MQHYKDQFTVAPLRHMLLNSLLEFSQVENVSGDGLLNLSIIVDAEMAAVDVVADFLGRV